MVVKEGASVKVGDTVFDKELESKICKSDPLVQLKRLLGLKKKNSSNHHW